MRVDGEGGGHRPWAAVVTAGNRISVNLQVFDIGIVDAILPTGVVPGGERRVGFKRAVGAAGVHRAQLARDDAAIALDAAPNRDHGRMRRITRR